MEILSRQDYNNLEFEEKCHYINKAISEFGTRAKAYKNLAIPKSTVASMMKSHDYIFDETLKQFIHRENIEQSMEHRNTIEQSMEHRNTIEQSMEHRNTIEQSMEHRGSIVAAEKKDVIINKLCVEWDILERIIEDYKYKNNHEIIEVDTSVTLNDIPDSSTKRINLDINEEVWNDFRAYIKDKHKGVSQRKMVEIALLQYMKDKR